MRAICRENMEALEDATTGDAAQCSACHAIWNWRVSTMLGLTSERGKLSKVSTLDKLWRAGGGRAGRPR